MSRLGCASDYTAEVHLRGGRVLWTRLEGITKLTWGRKLGDYAEASVTIAKSQASRECLRHLADVWDTSSNRWTPGVHAWSHELTIRRDGGIVFQGPIYQPTETRSEIEIPARDVLAWLERRIIDVTFEPGSPDAADVLRAILERTFPDGDTLNNQNLSWNIPPQLGVTYQFDKKICQGSSLVSSVVQDVCKVGIDMFTLGRRMYFRNTVERSGHAPYRLTAADFLGDIEVREGGPDMCTEGYAYGKEPRERPEPPGAFPCAEFGAWPNPNGDPPPAGWASQWFGRVSKWQEASQTNDKPTLVNMARSTFSFGWPPPRAIVIPQQGQLAPDAPVSIGQLVPGRPFRVSLPDYVFTTSELFRLNEVEVTWQPPSPEQVQISLVSQQQPPDDTEPTA